MTDSTQSDHLIEAKLQWLVLIDGLPEMVPGVSQAMRRDSVTAWFDVVIVGVQRLENEIVDSGLMSIYWPTIKTAIAGIESHMLSATGNGASWLAQTTGALMSYLWTIRAALPWLLADSEERVNTTVLPLVGELISHAHEITEASQRVVEAELEMKNTIIEGQINEEEIKTTLERVIVLERQAQTSSTNASASAVAIEAEKSKVDRYVTTLQAAETAQKELFDQFENKRSDIDAILEGASKVAMARSFQERRKVLTLSQNMWAAIFILGIIGLAVIGYLLGVQLLESMPGVKTGGSSEGQLLAIVPMLIRFLVLGPIVWLTWFAARQYGHLLRLAEDYAFKEAAAHAFVGYRKEMGEDTEMLHLLREYAITNFGANPVRTLSKNEPVTPLNDLLDRTLGKASPDKVIELVTAFFKKEGK